MRYADTPEAAATLLAGHALVSAEMMYRPRPPEGRARVVFDFTFQSRLSRLGTKDAVLLLCDSPATADSLLPLIGAYPALLAVVLIVNPVLLSGSYGDTPFVCEWPEPERWQRFQTTDRWARIDAALQVGSRMSGSGLLATPAHDAVWGDDLLPRLRHFAEAHGKNGLPAAISPYTPYPHSSVPGADIPPDIIDLMNVTLMRDPTLHDKIRDDAVQGFWGKMGLLPFAVCAALRAEADQGIWEDDLEIDRVLRALGYGVACLWIDDPAVYRQAPPVFDRDDVRRVIDRTLHYSLNIGPQASALMQPNQLAGATALAAESDTLIAECRAAMEARLEQYGASWVDWGAYRYVARPGDPYVEVWRQLRSSRTPD